MNTNKLEIIKGYNEEKQILTYALTHLSHNESIKIKQRLSDIDCRLDKLLTDNPIEE